MNLLVPQNLIDKFLKSKYKDEEFSVAIKPGEPVDIDWKKLFKGRTKIRFVVVKDTPGSDKFFKNIDKLYNIYDIFDGIYDIMGEKKLMVRISFLPHRTSMT